MKATTILAVTKDAEWLVGLRPALREAGRWRLVVCESIMEAERLLVPASPQIVLLDWRREPQNSQELASLLWQNSIRGRRASVMIVAADYQIAEATDLFRLGVDEYVSQEDHRDVLGSVLSAHSASGAGREVWAGAQEVRDDGVYAGLVAAAVGR